MAVNSQMVLRRALARGASHRKTCPRLWRSAPDVSLRRDPDAVGAEYASEDDDEHGDSTDRRVDTSRSLPLGESTSYFIRDGVSRHASVLGDKLVISGDCWSERGASCVLHTRHVVSRRASSRSRQKGSYERVHAFRLKQSSRRPSTPSAPAPTAAANFSMLWTCGRTLEYRTVIDGLYGGSAA